MSIIVVANLAGVSKSTVSRVINNDATVRPEVVQMVHDAMRKLNYSPPLVRRGPKPKGWTPVTGNAGLLMTGWKGADLYQMPVLQSLMHGLGAALAKHQMNLVLLTLNPDGSLPTGIGSDRLDGMFLLRKIHPVVPDVMRQLSRMAVVWLMRDHNDDEGLFDHVLYNNESVGRLVARYVIQRGHKSAAYLNADAEHPAFSQRQQVFARVLGENGIELREFVSPSHAGRPQLSEHETLVGALAKLKPRPTALFVPNDQQLPGVYHVLRSRGIMPGRDIEVISCDNDPAILNTLTPRPVSVDIKLEQVGHWGVQQLLYRAKHMNEPDRFTLMIEPKLVGGEEI